MEDFSVEKWVYTQDDFDNLDWHDSLIRAFAFSRHLMFDLDFILKRRPSPDSPMKYWVAPSTCVFKNVFALKIHTEVEYGGRLQISEIERLDLAPDYWSWTIRTVHGHIEFLSGKFEQFIRTQPILLHSPEISIPIRKGLSFSEEVRGEVDYILYKKAWNARERIAEIRKAMRKQQKLMEDLIEARNGLLIDVKTFLKRHKEIAGRLDALRVELNLSFEDDEGLP